MVKIEMNEYDTRNFEIMGICRAWYEWVEGMMRLRGFPLFACIGDEHLTFSAKNRSEPRAGDRRTITGGSIEDLVRGSNGEGMGNLGSYDALRCNSVRRTRETSVGTQSAYSLGVTEGGENWV